MRAGAEEGCAIIARVTRSPIQAMPTATSAATVQLCGSHSQDVHLLF